MEFDTIWDEGFFSLGSEELDYEFDDNDLFANDINLFQDTIKKENLEEVQPDLDLKHGSTLNNNLFNAKLVLKRLPNDITHRVPLHTNFDTVKFKDSKKQSKKVKVSFDLLAVSDEIVDKKPVIRFNLLQLPKAKVVLRKLTDAELKSSASLLCQVKSEINENVSRKLRSQGKARNKDFIHRYCCKCKNLQVDHTGLSKTKNCDNCDSQLIYFCAKCSEKHYLKYYHLQRHLKKCRGSGDIKPQGLDSIVLHCCTQCTFKTTRTERMASHMKNKGHKANGEIVFDEVHKSPKVRVKREVSIKPKMSPKIPRTRYAKLIVKQNDTNVASITELYCITCNKPQSSRTRKPAELCHRCKTKLQLRCLQCSQTYSTYRSMHYHLRSKCQPSAFKCAKCNYTNSTWSLIQQHVMEQHDNKSTISSRTSKSKKKCGDVFNCPECSFHSLYAQNVKRHMKRFHEN